MRQEKLPVVVASAGARLAVPLDAGYHSVRRHATGAAQGAGLERDRDHGGHDGEGAEVHKRPYEGSAAVGVEERAASERAHQPAHDGESAAQHHPDPHADTAQDESAEGAGRGPRQSEADGDPGGRGRGKIVSRLTRDPRLTIR